jgi:hypothetical protein
MANRYCKSSQLSEGKYWHTVKCFALDLTTPQTAELVGVSRNAVNRVFARLRGLIFEQTLSESPFSGEIEADESYFGPRRVKGKHGRRSENKTIVFGLFKRNIGV